MPSIDENRENWNDNGRWEEHGEEWSQAWGSTASMWFGTILPRLAPWLPAGHVLEIACGHGRVTAFLLGHCTRYTGVDLNPNCVEISRRRFADRGHATFHETDGRSLPMVEADSVDLAVSWDSLVHADRDALGGYLSALATTLAPGGAAFLHHSNLGDHVDASGEATVENPHWRDSTTSAAVVRELAIEAGLECRTQELVQWGSDVFNDCFTVVGRPTPGAERAEPRLYRHPDMNAELGHFKQLDAIYRTATPKG